MVTKDIESSCPMCEYNVEISMDQLDFFEREYF